MLLLIAALIICLLMQALKILGIRWGKVLDLPVVRVLRYLNADSSLVTRIDYILFKNGWKPKEAELVGEEQSDKAERVYGLPTTQECLEVYI